MLDDEVALCDLGEQAAVLRVREAALRRRYPRSGLEVGAVDVAELRHVGEVELALNRIDEVGVGGQALLEPLEHRVRDRTRHLESHDRAEPALLELDLDRDQQVGGVVRDLGVAVAGEAEGSLLDDLHLREEPAEVVADHLLERNQEAPRAD